MNKTDPRADPRGTPCSSADQELNILLILHPCQRSDIQLNINFKKSLENLQSCNLTIKVHGLWCQKLLKSQLTLPQYNLHCQAFSYIFQ